MTKESYNKTVFAKMEITTLSNTTIDENKKIEQTEDEFWKTWSIFHLNFFAFILKSFVRDG